MNVSDHQGIGMTSQRTRSRLVQRLKEEGIENKVILDLIETIPRHVFVDEAMSHRAYEDSPLPIGLGQTISQPYIVAKMTELLAGAISNGPVLEIGTGCGYQTAILAALFDEVYTVERLGGLQQKAKKHLQSLKIHNVHYRHSDGWRGWSRYAPYKGILVTAAAETVPDALLKQLDPDGGAMVIPVGASHAAQELYVIRRNEDNFERESIIPVRFVPLIAGSVE